MIKLIEIEIKPKKRWEVIFQSYGWRAGIYVPENTSLQEVSYLEKHDKPELFYLIRGKIILVISKDGETLEKVEMDKGKIYIVTEWHNAYRPMDCEGIALVVEAPDIETVYRKLK